MHTLSAECEQLSPKVHGQSPTGSEGGALGQGYLCFILPEEKMFSTYYEIKCDCR